MAGLLRTAPRVKRSFRDHMEAALKAHPQIAEIVKPLMQSFDRATLQQLNERVQINGEADEAVAADYLRSRGFLK